MLLLLFGIGNDRFSLDAQQVIEVVPLIRLKNVPHSPGYVAGLFNFRGTVVPVIDLTDLISGTASKHQVSTRIILVPYADSENNSHILELFEERVTGTLTCNEDDLELPGIESESAEYLDKILFDTEGMIQLINLKKILPESLKDTLFTH